MNRSEAIAIVQKFGVNDSLDLDDRQKAILQFDLLNQFNDTEIAARLNCSVQTVRSSRTSAARKVSRQAVSDTQWHKYYPLKHLSPGIKFRFKNPNQHLVSSYQYTSDDIFELITISKAKRCIFKHYKSKKIHAGSIYAEQIVIKVEALEVAPNLNEQSSVTTLNLSKRSLNTLHRAGIYTIDQLHQERLEELATQPRCGAKTIAEISEALNQRKLNTAPVSDKEAAISAVLNKYKTDIPLSKRIIDST